MRKVCVIHYPNNTDKKRISSQKPKKQLLTCKGPGSILPCTAFTLSQSGRSVAHLTVSKGNDCGKFLVAVNSGKYLVGVGGWVPLC